MHMRTVFLYIYWLGKAMLLTLTIFQTEKFRYNNALFLIKLLYLTSVFSYNFDFTSGASRPCNTDLQLQQIFK